MRIEFKARLNTIPVRLPEDKPAATVVVEGDGRLVEYIKRLVETPDDITVE